MREFFRYLLIKDKCKILPVLPNKVKENLAEITSSETYDKNQWEINIKQTGPSQPRLHYRLFCNHCQYVLLLKLVDQYRNELGSETNIDNIIPKWDELTIPSKYVDYMGCFIPWEKAAFAGRNARKLSEIKWSTQRQIILIP